MKRIISLILFLVFVLSITPLAIAEEDYGENLCLGKEAYADTIYQDQAGFLAIHANDGNENTMTATGSNSADVRNGFQNYVVIDLGEVYKLNRVIVRSRRDLDAAWARQGFAAYLANKADFSDAVQIGVKDFAGEFKSDLEIDLKEPYSARYVIAANVNKTSSITVAEIEAYGEETALGGKVEYSDLNGTAKNAATLLQALGVMDGVSDTEFGAANLITRGEAAMYMCKYAQIPVGAVNDTSFEDVDSTHPYAPYIYAGRDYGIISVDTHFRPDDYLKGYELIKMILCINGYYPFTQNGTIYPTNIIDAAMMIDLLDNLESDCLSYISKSDAAVLMYNALISTTYEYKNNKFTAGSKTLLEKLHGCKLMRGVLRGNGATQLDVANSGVVKENVNIDGVQYLDQSGTSMMYIGEMVYFMVDDERNIHALWTDEQRCNTVTIFDHEIEKADFNTIEVYSGNKTKKYKIDAHPYTLFNGVADSSITELDLIPANGYLTLVDNDNDNVFEVIRIYKPEIIYVSATSIDEETSEINISDASGAVKSITPDYVRVANTSGNELSIGKIKPGKLIYWYESRNGKILNVEIQDAAIEGTITSTGSDYVSVNNEEYELSTYFKNTFLPVEIGKNAKFFLDKNDRLIYMMDEGVGKATDFLAIVRKAIINPDDGINSFDIYDENKQFRSLQLADKVMVNETRKDLHQIQALGRGYFEGKLVLITVNGDGLVKTIITEDYAGGDIYKSSVTLNDSYRGNSGFYAGTKLVLPISDNVPYFTLPIDTSTGRPGTGAKFERLYNVQNLSSAFNLRARLGANNIRIYGLNEFGEATALINRCYYSPESSTYGVISSYSSQGAMVFDSYEINSNADGEIFYTLNGYDLATGRARKVQTNVGLNKVVNTFKIRNIDWFESENIPEAYLPDSTWMQDTKILYKEKVNSYFLDDITTLQKGDIIRYDNAGYDGVSQLEVIVKNIDFDESKCKVVYNAGDAPETIMATYRLQYALAEWVKDGHIKFLYQPGIYETLDLSVFGGSILVLEDGYFQTYPATSAGVCISPGDKIVVYTNASYHKSIIVYK